MRLIRASILVCRRSASTRDSSPGSFVCHLTHFDHQARGPSGEPGRKETTADIAEFALGGKQQEMTWKEILLAWRRQFPDDHRVKNWESIREAYRRRFGDKAKYRRRGRVEVVDGLPKTHS